MARLFRRSRSAKPQPTKVCPHCGATVAAKALACRECGSDAQTGWADEEEIHLQSVDLPEFDDDDYARTLDEMGIQDPFAGEKPRHRRMPLWVFVVAWITIGAFVLLILNGF